MFCLKIGNGFLRGIGVSARQQLLNEARLAWSIDQKTHISSGGSNDEPQSSHRQSQLPPPPSLSTIIYRGNLSSFIKATKFVSLSSSAFGLAAQPLLLNAWQTMSASLAVVAGCGTFLVLFTYVTPLLLHWITRKYVTEMRFEPRSRTFTATTLSFFLMPKRISFRAVDVHVPDVPGLFTTFVAKDRPLFVDFRQFDDIEAFRHLMGYDKPLDFKLDHKQD